MVIVFECLEEWICLASAQVFPFTLKGGFSIFFCCKISTEHAGKTKMGKQCCFWMRPLWCFHLLSEMSSTALTLSMP